MVIVGKVNFCSDETHFKVIDFKSKELGSHLKIIKKIPGNLLKKSWTKYLDQIS